MKARTRFRPLHGILLLDKPSGMSSNQALQRVRHLYRAEKAGHTGSLDPLATGLLPVCFGEATKIAGLLLGAGKAYETVARLGTTTDTDDADGVVLRERAVPALDDATIEAALRPLRGSIRQRAPIYSALKQGGERLYALARKGLPVEAPERDVLVHRLDVLERGDGQLRLRIECGSGTYVRSIVRDLGEALGCGAHVTHLRRLWVDPFTSPAMATLEELQADALLGEATLESRLLPLSAGLAAFTSAVITTEAAARFGHGQPVDAGTILLAEAGSPADASAPVAVARADGLPLGLATLRDGRLHPQRLFRFDATV